MRSAVKNAADKDQVAEAKIAETFNRGNELDDVRQVASTDAGLRFLQRLLDLCHTFGLSYNGRAPDTYFVEGKRSVGLQLIEDIDQADPGIYAKLVAIKKAKREEEANARRKSSRKHRVRQRRELGDLDDPVE